MRVKDIPLHDRPRERAWREGIFVLSDVELLAILLRTGRKGKSAVVLAGELWSACHGDWSLLEQTLNSVEKRPKEIGKVQRITLQTVVEVCRRSNHSQIEPRTLDEALDFIFSRIRNAKEEHAFVICLDLRNNSVGFPLEWNRGSTVGVELNPRDVLSYVTRQNAARVVIVHNHPSGDVSPSPQDVLLTKQLMEGAKWVGVELYDHLIVSRNDVVSFRAKGWLD
ncbi:MAG: DNA repair protein RadC [archaeon]